MNARPTEQRMLNGRLLFQTALMLVLDSRITRMTRAMFRQTTPWPSHPELMATLLRRELAIPIRVVFPVVPQTADIVVQDVAIARRHAIICYHSRQGPDHLIELALIIDMIG
jgi:hypothetical protein